MTKPFSSVILALYMCIYGVGSPVPWLIASELFSQEYRSTAVSLGTFTSFLMAFFVSSFYLPLQVRRCSRFPPQSALQELVGASYSFTPFIAILSLCLLFLLIFLPETKNRNIDDIVQEFKLEEKCIFHGEPDSRMLENDLDSSLGGEHLDVTQAWEEEKGKLLGVQEKRDERRYWGGGYGTAQG